MTPCRAGDEGRETGEAADRGVGFTAGTRDPFDIKDYAAVHFGAAGRNEDEFDAPRGLAVAFDMQAGVGFVTPRAQLAGGRVEVSVAGFGGKERGDDLAVGVEHSRQVRVGPGAGAIGVDETKFAGLAGGDLAVGPGQLGDHGRVGQVAVAGIQIMMTSHRRVGEPLGGVAAKALPYAAA